MAPFLCYCDKWLYLDTLVYSLSLCSCVSLVQIFAAFVSFVDNSRWLSPSCSLLTSEIIAVYLSVAVAMSVLWSLLILEEPGRATSWLIMFFLNGCDMLTTAMITSLGWVYNTCMLWCNLIQQPWHKPCCCKACNAQYFLMPCQRIHLCLRGVKNQTELLQQGLLQSPCQYSVHFTVQVLHIVSNSCGWRSSTHPQSAFTVSSPTPHHFAVWMQVHMTARANLWKRHSQLLLSHKMNNGSPYWLILMLHMKGKERIIHTVDFMRNTSRGKTNELKF